MKIRAFHGLRYNGNADQAGALAAPPYDQINDDQRDRLHRTEHHFAHLIRPVGSDEATGPHDNSARLHASWLESDVLVRDSQPALYGNSIEDPDGTTRLGLTALVDIEDPGTGIIRPHEETVDKTVAERLGLLRTTGIDYEPILLLADDRGALETLLEEDCRGDSVATHIDDFGSIHRLYPIVDDRRLASYRQALETSYSLIADGHHRYRTGGLHAADIGAERGTAAAAKLGVITSLESSALAIDPIHRALPLAIDPQTIEPLAQRRETLSGLSGSELAQRVAAAPQPTLAVLTPDGSADLWHLNPEFGPTDLPGTASQLSVILLHRTLFPRIGLSAANATDGTVAYRSDPEELATAIAHGDFQSGIFLPPMTAEGFAGAVANGDVLPPKSTRFLPKVVSGLVWGAHDDPVA